MSTLKAKKTFVVSPNSHPSYKIICSNMVKNGDYFEFTDETGIVAYIPTAYSIVLEENLVTL